MILREPLELISQDVVPLNVSTVALCELSGRLVGTAGEFLNRALVSIASDAGVGEVSLKL